MSARRRPRERTPCVGCDGAQITRFDSGTCSHRVGNEFCAGLTFVALSRAKSLDGFMLLDQVNFSRVEKLGGKGLDERMRDRTRRYSP